MKDHRWQVRNEGRPDSSRSYECADCGWWKFVASGVDGEETIYTPPEWVGDDYEGEFPEDCDEADVKSALES